MVNKGDKDIEAKPESEEKGRFRFGKIGPSVLVHIAVWGVLFALPVIYYIEDPSLFKFARRTFTMLIGLAITFYGNYLWAIGNLFYRKHYLLFALFNIALFFFVGELRDVVGNFIDNLMEVVDDRPKVHSVSAHSLFVYNDVIFFLLVIGASLGIFHGEEMRSLEMARKKLENETLTSELQLLRYQVQPHFFFNSLNNIYALIGRSPGEAQKAVMSLSKMMRYILYDSSTASVSLTHEVSFINNYAQLMCLRLHQGSQFDFATPETLEGITVPPLVFIPLVENAFKHGVAPDGTANIQCTLSVDNDQLTFSVSNKAYPCHTAEDKSRSGIGLTNLVKRLDILYANTYSFTKTLSDDNIFTVAVCLPLSDRSALGTNVHSAHS